MSIRSRDLFLMSNVPSEILFIYILNHVNRDNTFLWDFGRGGGVLAVLVSVKRVLSVLYLE